MFSDPGLIHWTAVDQHWIFLLSGYISLAPCSPFPFHSGRAQSSCFTFFHYNYIALFFDSILFSDAVWVFLMLTYFIYTILCDFLGSYKNGHTIWLCVYFLLLLEKISLSISGVSHFALMVCESSYGLWRGIAGLFYLSNYLDKILDSGNRVTRK